MSTTAEVIPATTLPAGTTSSSAVATSNPAPAVTVTPVVVDAKAPVAAVPAQAELAFVEKKSLLADAPPAEVKPTESVPAVEAKTEILYALKAPEKSALSVEDVKNIEAWAKEQHVSAEVAQAVVNRESKLIDSIKSAETAAAKAGVERLYDTWAEQSQKDPVIGGANWANTTALAKRALNLDPDFKALISTSPFGNHPKVLAFLAKVGALTREDGLPSGGSVPQVQTKTPSQRWFGKQS